MRSLIVRLTLLALCWHALFGCCVHHGHSAHLAACEGDHECECECDCECAVAHGDGHARHVDPWHDRHSCRVGQSCHGDRDRHGGECPDPAHDGCRESSCLFIAAAKSSGDTATTDRLFADIEPERWFVSVDLALVGGAGGVLGRALSGASCRDARAASVPLFVLHQVRLI